MMRLLKRKQTILKVEKSEPIKMRPSFFILIMRMLLLIVAVFTFWAYFNKIPLKVHLIPSKLLNGGFTHFCGFFTLGGLTVISFPKASKFQTVSVIMLVGIFAEIIQPVLAQNLFGTERTVSVSDAAANLSGGIIGCLFGMLLVFITTRLRNKVASSCEIISDG